MRVKGRKCARISLDFEKSLILLHSNEKFVAILYEQLFLLWKYGERKINLKKASSLPIGTTPFGKAEK